MIPSEEKKFVDKFKSSYNDLKKIYLSGNLKAEDLVVKFSNEIDKLISKEVEINYKSSGIVILALGGYGRRELCLKSDIDILILHEETKLNQAKKLAENILYKLWDTGLEVGNSLRTIDQSLELASMQDSTILSSMMDLRAITGDSSLYVELKNKLNRKLLPNISQNFINEKLLEKNKRHSKYTTPSFLVEPDIKEGKGCLRDIHSCFWIARASLCDLDLNKFFLSGYISKENINVINTAHKFFLNVRNFLHSYKTSHIDVIDFESQKNLAEFLNIKEDDFLSKERVLMKTFNDYSNQIYDVTNKIIEKVTNKKVFQSKRIQNLDDFFIIHQGILKAINPQDIKKNPSNIIKAFELSTINNIEIADEVMSECKKLNKIKFTKDEKKLLINYFMETLKKNKNNSLFLENLNKANLLIFFIPEFEKVRNLALADPSHIYSVDIHSIYLIKEFEKLFNDEYKDEFPFETKIAKRIKRKDIFSLVALLHDIGKGYGKGHSERGAAMSLNISERLLINNEYSNLIEFLIKEHLTMSTVSQKRDIDDADLIQEFKKRIKTIERLEYLFILTFCDLRSVAPDVWSEWKGDLLRALFRKTSSIMIKKKDKNKKINSQQKNINFDVSEIDKLIGKNRKQYFDVYSEDEINYQLKILKNSNENLIMGIRYSVKKKIDQLTFWSRDKSIGFVEICGALTSESINIFSARLAELKKNLHVYTLEVNRFGKSTFKEREIWENIKYVLENKKIKIDDETNIKNLKKYKSKLKAKIKIDNDLSKKFTIIELTSGDKPGMLYSIVNKIKQLGLRIRFVKISTKRESVEDAFYVTKDNNEKIFNLEQISEIKDNIMNIIR